MRGRAIPCQGSGQDGEYTVGLSWPVPRFEPGEGVVLDRLTGLTWSRDASIFDYPVNWEEAFELVAGLNLERVLGFTDWRIPNRRELRSLLSYETTRPPLPEGHPFRQVQQTLYWTSSTVAMHTGYAWFVHMGGGRVFYSAKRQYGLLWPVRGSNSGVFQSTGEARCLDVPRNGIAPTEVPRFEETSGGILDRLTGLCWHASADVAGGMTDWADALGVVRELNRRTGEYWRLPNINELASLVDMSRHSPALSPDGPFANVQDGYWSSTTSMFEPDWAWCLYLNKGAIGVGWKPGKEFHVWPVRTPLE